MNPAPVGTRIRVITNRGNHSYIVGRVYRVVHDDRDGTFKAADESGAVGNWLRWEDCEPAEPSTWTRIATDLPEDLVRFLSCFDGIAEITLKEEVVDAVLGDLPDLHERLVATASKPGGALAIAANTPPREKEGKR